MHIFISTGEVSGDLQGGMLVESLYSQSKNQGLTTLRISALGGEKMARGGAHLIGDTTAIGSVGLLESLPFIIPTWQVQQKAKKFLKNDPPDAVVLIDYLGPNLGIATFMKQNFPHIPVIWYIAPQYWVWTPIEQNVKQLVSVTDQVLAIFPAEAKFYQSKGLNSTYVGHPLIPRMKKAPSTATVKAKLGITADDQNYHIGLLPASRQQELKYLFPVMLESAVKIKEKVPNARFYLPISLPKYKKLIQEMIESYGIEINLFEGDTLDLFPLLDLAITKSGTVNLELGLLKIPQVVIYKISPFTMWIGRNILKYSAPFISPVNLIVEEEIVPELLQEKANVENIVRESLDFLLNEKRRVKMAQKYQEMQETLDQGITSGSEKAGEEILKILMEN